MVHDEDQKTLGVLIEQGRWMAHKLESLEKKVDTLISFKWKVIGASSIVAFISTLAIEVLKNR